MTTHRTQLHLLGAFLGATALSAGPAAAQNFITDVTIQGSLCVGIDCTTSVSFGFDTVILQENNLRLFFNDTSVSASFPRNDWRLTANESSNGGANRFSIDDATAGRRVFAIEAGAPTDSLFVDSAGRVGVGDGDPVVEMHITDGDSPTVRLEQDGSSGFTPQTWDVAGNETNFFVRDVTNGSKLPFKLIPGAPTNSLYVASDGDVGLGTSAPAEVLHLRRSSGSVAIRLDSGSQPNPIKLNFNTNQNEFRITYDGLGINQLQLDSAGNMTIAGGLVTGTAGSCTSGTPCDGVFDPELYTVPAMEDYAAVMWENGHLPSVGPTVAGEPVNVTGKMLLMLNELEHAHIYIDQLNTRVKAQNARIATLEALLVQE